MALRRAPKSGASEGRHPACRDRAARRFDISHNRVAIPLLLQSALPGLDPRFNPTFEIEGNAVVLNPLHIVSVALERLGERVGSLKDDGDNIIAAIDMLITRAWD